MRHIPRRRVLTPLLALAALALFLAPGAASAKGSLSKVEDEFEKAIRKVTPATVVCLPWGVEKKKIVGGSSGVIVSRKGLVLSDGDVGIYVDPPAGTKPTKAHYKWSKAIEIRLPSLKGKGFQSFKATVLKRDRDLDTTLMRIEKPPGSLKYVKMGDSDALQVGDFTFAAGNSFGLAAEAPPTLTAGVVASLVPKPGDAGGKWSYVYTSAAVNPGVNGGPLVDIRGRLVGTISNVVSLGAKKPEDPEMAYAYLGKVIPVQRLKDHYKDLAESAELFPEADGGTVKLGDSASLAAVFHHTARRAYNAVVSLEIKRKGQLSLAEPAGRGTINIPRYLGPVSGVLVSQDGFVLTSLYNLANLRTLIRTGRPWDKPPDNAKVKAGLDGIQTITVHLPDARKATAKVIAYHEGIGVALLKADIPKEGTTASSSYELLQPAGASHLRAGRFLLAVGNPFGVKRLDDPLLTVGVLSKQHAESIKDPWAGQWQTDAGITDANSGGAAVDLHGRLLGIVTIWSSTMHGRNSGIGFVVPWTQIEPVLPEMMRGRTFRPPMFGIYWKQLGNELTTLLDKVIEGKAAHKAGLQVGDEIVKIDGQPVATPADVHKVMRGKWSGDTLLLTIRRAGKEQEIKLVLGARE